MTDKKELPKPVENVDNIYYNFPDMCPECNKRYYYVFDDGLKIKTFKCTSEHVWFTINGKKYHGKYVEN